MAGTDETAEGTPVWLGHEAGEAAGRIAILAAPWTGEAGNGDVDVTLVDGSTLPLPHGSISPAWAPHVSKSLAEAETALTNAKRLVALLTIRDVVEEGGEALTASGLNPYCMNEGRATGEEPLNLWQVDAAIKRARAAIDTLDAGETGDDLVESLRSVAEVAGDTAHVVRLPTIGAAFDAGDETIEAAGIDVWCMRDGRATREERVGSNASWRLEAASRDLAQIASDLEFALGHAPYPTPPAP